MEKAYSRIEWENKPSIRTPLDATNLNKMDLALNTVDNRVVTLDLSKADQSDLLSVVQSITLNELTGVLTITQVNGTVTTYDTDLEKIAVNFDFDDDPTSQHYQELIIQLDDGTYKYVDLSAFVTNIEIVASSTIQPITSGGQTSLNIKQGSITDQMLETQFLVQIGTSVIAAASSAQTANDSAVEARNYRKRAEAWAVGKEFGTSVLPVDETYDNNAKYYSQQSQLYSMDSEAWAVGKRDGVDVPSTDETYQNNAKYWAGQASQAAGGGVTSFNGRTGSVSPQSGDYTASMVGLGNVGNFKAVSTAASQGLTSSEKTNAKDNIDVMEWVSYSRTLSSSGWDSNDQQSVTISTLTADTVGIVGLGLSATAIQRSQAAKVHLISQSAQTLTFEAEVVPTENIPIVVNIQE